MERLDKKIPFNRGSMNKTVAKAVKCVVPGSRAVGVAPGRADDHGTLDLSLRPVPRNKHFVVVVIGVAFVGPLLVPLIVEVSLQARRSHHRAAVGVLLPVPPLRYAVSAVTPPVEQNHGGDDKNSQDVIAYHAN